MNTLNSKQHTPQANQTATIVKNRMREFGLDYQLNERLLEVRLQHGRKLVVTLPADNAALAQKWLSRIPQSVAAINSVPSRYRVESRHRANTTVTRKEDAERFTFVISVEEIIVSLPKGRELALKQSQEEVERHDDYSIFTLRLRPTFDFKQELLRCVDALEVLEPQWLRDDMTDKVRRMWARYNK